MKFKKLDPQAKQPVYATQDAAGADLYACSAQQQIIAPGETRMIRTGIAVQIPRGYVGLIFARSGMATRRGLAPANKVGVIDADYRGEILVALYNQSDSAQVIEPYERIAQMVIVPFLAADYEECDDLEDTDRSTGGFGSTGRI